MSKELGKKIKCESAGIGAFSGMGPTEEALKVLKTEGIDARAHKSQRVTRELVKNSDIIFVMQRMHESFIIESCPDAKDKVFLLGEFVKEANERVLREGIADPIGMGLSSYEETKLIIKNALGVIFEKLKG
jgi:protein-tyrosine phosphatase